MKRGTIYQNLWAGFLTYFVYFRTLPGPKGRNQKVEGIGLILLPDGEWKVLLRAQYYRKDVEFDRAHYPIVGILDPEYLDLMIIRAIRNSIDPEIGRMAERRLHENDGKG